MANNNQIYKMSNAGGFKSLTRYYDMLAGNTTWNPWEPQGAFDALATVTVPSGGVASVVFAGIPTGYKHLQIRGIAKSNRSTYVDDLGIRFNSDTGSNYSSHRLYSFGSGTPGADGGGSQTQMNIGQIAGGTVNNSQGMGAVLTDILDYANENKFKTIRVLSGYDDNGQGAVQFASGNWRSTNPITSITLLPLIGTTFSQYTSFALFGVK